MAGARDEVLEMLRGGSPPASPELPATRQKPASARDEVLSMLQGTAEAPPVPSGGLMDAASEQAGKMGRFFTEGIPQAARVAYQGMQEASTAPTFGTFLRSRGTEGTFPERMALGGISPIPGVVDLAERFMNMYGAAVRGVAELGPEKAKPLTEALVGQAPFIPRAGWSALGQDLRAATGRMPRPGPAGALAPEAAAAPAPTPPAIEPPPIGTEAASPAAPFEWWPRGERVPDTTPPSTASEVPPAIRPLPDVSPLAPNVGEPSPPAPQPRAPGLGTPRPAPFPETSGSVRLFRSLESGDPWFYDSPEAAGPGTLAVVDVPGKVARAGRRNLRGAGDAYVLPDSWVEGATPMEALPTQPESAALPRLQPQPEPPVTGPRLPEAPPEPPLAPEMTSWPPRPPRPPRPGDITAGANPEFADAKAAWQSRLAQIDYGTVNLRDPDEVRAFIKGVGGVRPGPDYPDIPFFFKNRSGRPVDEIVQEIANAQGKPVPLVERQLTDTLMRYQALRAEKRARPGAVPAASGEPPTMQEWEQQVNADPESAYPLWLRGVAPPIPLPDLPPEEQDTTKGRFYRALQIVGLAAPAIGMAASIRWRPAAGRGPLSSFRSEDQRFRVTQETPDVWRVADQTSKTEASFPTFQAARQWAEKRLTPPATPLFEATALGDQAVIPGAEARAMPSTAVQAGRAQRPVEDLPLFGQEKAAREATQAKAQRSLFDYLKEERGAINPDRRAGASPPQIGARPPEAPAAASPETQASGMGGAADRPGAVDLARKPGAMEGLRSWAREFYSPLISQFERMGPAGRELSRQVQETEGQAQRWYGSNVDPIVRGARKLSKAEAENFRMVLEEGAQPISPRVEGLRRQYDRVFGPEGLIPREATDRNMIVMDSAGEARAFRARQDYFPHEFSPEVSKEIRERGPAYERAIKYLLDTGQAHDAETAGVMLAERFNFKRTTLGDRIFLMDPDRFVGGLERARDMDLPDYIRDPATAIAARGMKVARRFAELDHYGRLDANIGAPGGFLDPMTGQTVPAHGLIGEIQRTQGREEATHAASLFQQALGHQEYVPHLAGKMAAAKAINSFEAFTKLSLAVVANASQATQVALRTNLTSAAKGVAASLTRAGRDAARDLGVISDISMRQLYEDVSGQSVPGRALSAVMAPFNAVEKWDRIVGANAGLSWARTIEQRLASSSRPAWMGRELERLNFSPDEARQAMQTGALSEEQRSRIAWAITDQTQFLGRRYRRSEFFNTPLGSIIGQFKSFSINAGRLMKQNLIDEARHGNVAPILRLLAATPVAGEAVQDVKAIVRGTERPDNLALRVLDNMTAVGGFGLASDFVESTARRGAEGAASFAIGPWLTDVLMKAAPMMYRLGSAVGEGDEEKMGKRAATIGREVVRNVPIAGPWASQQLRDDPKGRQLQEMSVGERLKFE